MNDFVVPHLNGEIYAQKPPLYFWLAALLQSLGLGFGSGRIVSAIMAIGTALLSYALGRLWFPARSAFLGAMILSSSLLFLENDIPEGPPETRLAHAKKFVIDEFIRVNVVASGFKSFAAPDNNGKNYKGYLGRTVAVADPWKGSPAPPSRNAFSNTIARRRS